MPRVISILLASLLASFRSRLALQSDGQVGASRISKEMHELLQDMWRSNPSWGSPRIVGARHKIGIDVAKSTVEQYRPCDRKPPSPTLTFCPESIHLTQD